MQIHIGKHTLRRLHHTLDTWVRGRLWLQVLLGILLGVAAGLLSGPDLGVMPRATAELLGRWFTVPGQLFLGLIGITLIPLVGISIIQGIVGAPSGAALKSTGLRFLMFVVLTTAAAVVIGIALAENIRPGDYLDVKLPAGPVKNAAAVNASLPELITGLLPVKPEQAIVNRDMLAVVVLAVIVGLALRNSERKLTEPLVQVMSAMLQVAMTIVKWAMFLTPFAVFGLTANLVATTGLAKLAGLLVYVGTVVIGLLILLALYLAIFFIFTRKNPRSFLSRIGGVMLLAFSTSSSAAVMPLSINTAVKKLDVPESVANLVIPMGATVNMAGTALYQAVAVIFLTQLSGVELSTVQQAGLVTTLVLASIGAPGVPGVSIVILTSLIGNYGLPVSGIAFLLGVDRILDMSRTAVNVTGDLVAAVLLRDTGKNATQLPSEIPATQG